MASSEFDNEDSKVDGTQEAVLPTNNAPIPLPSGAIWDPVSKSLTHRTQDDQPDRFQVPGTPSVDQDYTMKTKNPEYEGVFAHTAAEPTGYRQIAQEFWQMSQNESNPTRQRQYAAKADYYARLADQYEPKANDPATTQAVNGAPAASDATDVYMDRTPKHDLQGQDNSFPGMISSRTPKVTSTMLNTGRNSYQEPGAPSLRDCPEAGCGGMMQDHDDESHCHTCGHKEKVHYAGILAPLAIGAEALEGAAAVGEGAEAAGAAGEAAGAAGEAAGASDGAMNLNTGVRAANLMHKVMNGGQQQSEGEGIAPEVTSGGSPDADESMGHNASSVADEEGLYSYDNDGDDSNPKAGNKGSEGQDENAPELGKDEDTSTGGSAGPLSGMDLFEVLEPYLLSIAGNDDSHEDPIAKALHELLLSEDPEYMSKAAATWGVPGAQPHAGLKGQAQKLIEQMNDMGYGGDAENWNWSLDDTEPGDMHEFMRDLKAELAAMNAHQAEKYGKTANDPTCPSCKMDLNGLSACGSADPNVACPVGLTKNVNMNNNMQPMQTSMGQNPIGMGQPMAAHVAAELYDQDEYNQPPVPSADYTLSQPYPQDSNGFDPSNKNTVQYISAPGSAFSIEIKSDEPDKLLLLLGDMAYHSVSYDYLRQNGPEYTANVYDETGAAADMRQIFDAVLRLYDPSAGSGAGAGTFESHTSARRPKMCPVHEQLVNYALLVGPGEALSAFSGSLFGEHSCQGGYEMINKAGNPTKCRYKPEMVTQAYWDEKDAQAEARQLEREQRQQLEQQQMQQVEPVLQDQPEPEGQLIGGPEYEAQQEAVEEKAPVTQDIPSFDGFQTDEDYMPAEQGANDADFAEQFAIAASYKWSGPTAELEAPEKMFSDTPPEEVPSGDASDPRGGHDLPTDMEGNPLKVGMTYEVHAPNNKGYIPDRYVITAVDPSLIQFEVEAQKDLGQPFSFTSTLPTKQIASEGIQFRPTDDANPNARGVVDNDPTDSDNTKGSDVPGSVSDLDTGGNSKGASRKTADQYEDMRDWQRREEYDGPGEYVPPTRAYTQGDIDEMYPEGMTDENFENFNYIMDKDKARYDEGMQRNRDSEMEALRQEIAELKSRLGENAEDFDEDRYGDYPDSHFEASTKTAGRDYSIGEQRSFVNESGSARNLDKLDLSGTHYPIASDDPYADFLW